MDDWSDTSDNGTQGGQAIDDADVPVQKPSGFDPTITIGMIVIVEYEGELFPGRVTEHVNDGVKVICMTKSTTRGSTWKWPKQIDENIYPYCDVKFKNVCLNELQGTSRKVEYHVAELDDVWG